ncbi:MAG: TolC family protein [Xanthomonadaceae bacterium]|nr:TolC family protein [Xanthomonadaceae bacterium]
MKSALAGLLALSLGACAALPTSRAWDPQAEARAYAARRLDDHGLATSEARFGLPAGANAPWTPDRITVAAWYFDPALAQARATAERVQAEAAVAAQRANPTLRLGPEKVFSGLSAASPWTIGVALLLPMLHPGESAARGEIAAADTQAARDRLAQAVWQSRANAVAALRDVLLARHAQALAETAARADNALFAAVRQRVTAGEDDRGALLTAQLDMQRAAADLATRRARRIAAEHALAAAVGVPVAALNDAKLEWPQLETPPVPTALPPAALAEDAARNRIDLAALLERYRAAEARLRLVAGSRYPATSIAPGYLYDQGQRKLTFGADVELPLFHGADAQIRAAAAARDEAAAAARARQATILNQLDAARADYAQRYAAWQRMARAAQAARSQAARAAASRKAGQIDRRAELAARVASASAALAAQDALSAALNSLGRLEDVLQRPLWPASRLTAATAAGAQSASDHNAFSGGRDGHSF